MDAVTMIQTILRERGSADYAAIQRAIDVIIDAEKQSVFDPKQELANQIQKLKENHGQAPD